MEKAKKRLVPAHNKKSRNVTQADIERVMNESKILNTLCYAQVGLVTGCYAVAHSQIDDIEPLNFFVTRDGEIVINPTIIRHSNYTVDSKEGCLTFPDQPEKIVQRWHKCEVEYQSIDENHKLTEVFKNNLSGKLSFIFQHECDHANAKYI